MTKKHIHIRRLLSAILVGSCLCLLTPSALATQEPKAPVGKAEEGKGWVEVKATVPEGFDAAVIAMFTDSETYEEFTVQLLASNGYVGRKKLPYGTYTVNQAFVPTDVRYGGIPEADSFTLTGKESAAVPVLLNVDILEVYGPSKDSEAEVVQPVPDNKNPVLDEQPRDTDTSVTQDGHDDATENEDPSVDEKSEVPETGVASLITRIVLSLFATGVFIGLVVLVVVYIQARRDDL